MTRWHSAPGHSRCGLHINTGRHRCHACSAANAANRHALEGVEATQGGPRKCGGKGRPLTQTQVDSIHALNTEGLSRREIGRRLAIDCRRVGDVLNQGMGNPRLKDAIQVTRSVPRTGATEARQRAQLATPHIRGGMAGML